MARKKTKYELVTDEHARRETFRKRKSSLFKKLNELKTLCNINACAIIYDKSEDMPHFWPSIVDASELVHQFKSLPLASQTSHMMDLEGSLKKSLSKLNADLEKEKKKNHALEMEILLSKCLASEIKVDEFNEMDDLKELSSLLDGKIQLVNERIIIVKQSNSSASPQEDDDAEIGSHCGKEKQTL